MLKFLKKLFSLKISYTEKSSYIDMTHSYITHSLRIDKTSVRDLESFVLFNGRELKNPKIFRATMFYSGKVNKKGFIRIGHETIFYIYSFERCDDPHDLYFLKLLKLR